MLLSDLLRDASIASQSPPSRELVRKCSEAFLRLGMSYNPPPQAQEGPANEGPVRVCSACNGYYGPAFCQPVCATCHAFLYANDLDAEINLQIMSQAPEDQQGNGGADRVDDSDRDSGNEEPTDQEQNQEEMDQAGVAEEAVAVAPVAVAINEVVDGHINGVEDQMVAVEQQAAEVGIVEAIALIDEAAADGFSDQNFPDDIPAAAEESPEEEYIDPVLMDWADVTIPLSAKSYCPFIPPPALKSFVQVESLSQRLALLSFPRPSDKLSEGIVEQLPPEVLLIIFSFLDDVSLYAVGNVCRRWHDILRSQLSSEQWQVYTRRRWPLFRPLSLVLDWFSTYSALVESSFCLTCIYQMAEVIPADYDSLPLREKRLVHDLRLLVEDPPPGIKAQPLDSSNYHWQASITGPVGSPYEGGIFFLYLKVPFTFPFDPPEVRFLTKIFHPNVSRHGDIGIDSIQQHNWVSGLTIPKVLISIQSLLTDPYCQVCMEPEIGQLYRDNRKLFDAIARTWAWKFAMHDAIPPKQRI